MRRSLLRRKTKRTSPQPLLLELIDGALDVMLEEYYTDYPNETVGWILFSGAVLPLRNEANRPDAFEISEIQVAETLVGHNISPDDIFAIYHSHPTRKAEPSTEDHKFMAELHEVWPGKVHIILDHEGYRVWVYDEGVKEVSNVSAD